MNDLIRVVQLPVIEEQLQAVKDGVERRLAEVKGLACTTETLASVKAVRTQLNKEFEELEAMRKSAKAAVMAPYEKFEATYKDCAANAYKSAIADLGDKIRETENGIKAECLERLEAYFRELCALNGVEWLPFIRSGVVVDLTSAKQKTPKKLMAQIKEFVERVASDVECVSTMDNSEEIMAEYKVCLNVSTAISTVNTRRQRIEQERKAAEKRKALQEAQRDAVERVEAVAHVVTPPAQEKPVETLRITFTATGTRAQLIALREYMKEKGIKYE